MTPEAVLAMTQLIRFGVDSLDDMQSGKKTPEQVMTEYKEMTDGVKQAWDRWQNAGA
jgi:hypothetical protein